MILVTRPEPGATETAMRLEATGFAPVLAPALTIRKLPAKLPNPSQVAAVLVTSGQAIPAIPSHFHGTALLAVGDATAARARRAGFTDVVSAAGDATDLAALAAARCPVGVTLLLATGRGLGHPLAAALRAAGFRVIRRSLYAPVPARRIPAPATAALKAGTIRAVLFFSGDSAAAFVAMIEHGALTEAVRNADAISISPSAAVALRRLPWRRILVADRPNQDSMLALLR